MNSKEEKMPASAMTAITRLKLSAPAKLLEHMGEVAGKVLDYGSGRSLDAEILRTMGYDAHAYDPYWGPKTLPRGKFDTVLATYVLNVLPARESSLAIDEVKKLLRYGGSAYFTVRRDIPKEGRQGRVFQRYVQMVIPVVEENDRFCIYKWSNQ